MGKRIFGSVVGAVGLLLSALGCNGSDASIPEVEQHIRQPFTSVEATLLDFDFDSEVIADGPWATYQAIYDQLYYTVGSLNARRSVGRFVRLELSNVVSTPLPDGRSRVGYHAHLPVAWGELTQAPVTFAFTLPRSAANGDLDTFTAKYGTTCVDAAAHDINRWSMWYYYRPSEVACALDPADVITLTATVAPSPEVTTGKYPEYGQVWADDVLEVVAIFGKNDETATLNSDDGIQEYNALVRLLKQELAPFGLTSSPPGVSNTPGAGTPEVVLQARLADGKSVKITLLLVSKLETEGAAFESRFEELTPTADAILYNGHAGLGANVRSLLGRGAYVPGKYLLLLVNGCDTFAYTDRTLVDRRALLNPDDPEGRRYLDVVTNAMPSYFSALATDSLAVVRALLSVARPKTFDQILASFDADQVAVVTGEEDNEFVPGMPIGSVQPSPPFTFDAGGSVTRNAADDYVTNILPAGRYTVDLAPGPLAPGGDADLYVRVGQAPTLTTWDCRPYTNGSRETCAVTLPTPSAIFVKVVGYASGSNAYTLHLESQ